MRAERISRLASELADGTITPAAEALRGVEHDLRFQAELARYRRLLRELRSLRWEVSEHPRGLLEDVLAALDEAEVPLGWWSANSRRAVYIGGLAAATAAGVGGALVLARRRRFAA